jgi:hypothetical protein
MAGTRPLAGVPLWHPRPLLSRTRFVREWNTSFTWRRQVGPAARPQTRSKRIDSKRKSRLQQGFGDRTSEEIVGRWVGPRGGPWIDPWPAGFLYSTFLHAVPVFLPGGSGVAGSRSPARDRGPPPLPRKVSGGFSVGARRRRRGGGACSCVSRCRTRPLPLPRSGGRVTSTLASSNCIADISR